MTTALTRDQLAEALGRAGAGDRGAFKIVYEATSAKLMGVCLRILGDRQLAEDVLQDTYLIVWRKAEDFDPARASPITWLATIARNRAIDRLRAAGSRIVVAPVEVLETRPDEAPLASDLVETGEEVVRLNACLDELEDRTARAIRTAFFEGVTYDQLAEREGAPLGTMKSWIRRGLLRLRSCLER